jgi:hypothetical protein
MGLRPSFMIRIVTGLPSRCQELKPRAKEAMGIGLKPVAPRCGASYRHHKRSERRSPRHVVTIGKLTIKSPSTS